MTIVSLKYALFTSSASELENFSEKIHLDDHITGRFFFRFDMALNTVLFFYAFSVFCKSANCFLNRTEKLSFDSTVSTVYILFSAILVVNPFSLHTFDLLRYEMSDIESENKANLIPL